MIYSFYRNSFCIAHKIVVFWSRAYDTQKNIHWIQIMLFDCFKWSFCFSSSVSNVCSFVCMRKRPNYIYHEMCDLSNYFRSVFCSISKTKLQSVFCSGHISVPTLPTQTTNISIYFFFVFGKMCKKQFPRNPVDREHHKKNRLKIDITLITALKSSLNY